MWWFSHHDQKPFGLSLREKQINVSKRNMGIVRYKLDPNNPPKVSDEYLARFDAIKDENIDYSDAPDMGDADWNTFMSWDEYLAKMNAPKTSVTIRYDSDIIAWFKENAVKDGKKGKGYQTAMNAVLKAYVKAQKG
jgi:uncharacterized protein (DUF4415 family)